MSQVRHRKVNADDDSYPVNLADADKGEKDANILNSQKVTSLTSRLGPGLSIAVVLVFTAGTAVDRGYIPGGLARFLFVAGIIGLLIKNLTFRRWADENRYVLRFLGSFLVFLIELVVENFMVWVVSQTDQRKYDYTPALQDNVELAVVALEQGPLGHLVSWAARSRWAHVMHFLAALLSLAFGNVFGQVPYSGFGLMTRAMLTLTLSRLIRVACFMSTVLPSPRPGCFLRRFGKVARTWPEFWRLGMSSIRGSGGCNDLIFSGHCGFWVIAPLAFQTYCPHPLPVALLWTALVQTSIRDVLEHQHYSVDMILAVVCTWAVWVPLDWVYPASQPLPVRASGHKRDRINPFVLGLIVVVLVGVGVLIVVSGA